MDEEKPQKREKNKVKKRIIELIICSPGSDHNRNVLEPAIRKSLRESKIIFDQPTINKHLNELCEWGCIEKLDSKIPKHPNKWNIKNIKNLMRIREHFKGIRLNSYEKSLNIVFAESGYSTNSLAGLMLYLYLMLSSSFFDNFVELGIEKLKTNAWKLYIVGNNFIGDQYDDSNDNNLITCFNEINKRLSNSEMSNETFLERMREIVPKTPMILPAFEFSQLFDEKFPELASTIPGIDITLSYSEFCQLVDEKFPESTSTTHDKNEFLSLTVFYSLIYKYFMFMSERQFQFQDFCFSLLFKHFYHHDILIETTTPEEIKFAKKIKEKLDLYLSSSAPVNDKKNELINGNLDLASEVMVEKKLPQIFDPKIYVNREDLKRALVDHFKLYLADIPEDVYTTLKLGLKSVNRDNPEDNYNLLSKIILQTSYYSNNSIED
jgi:hypothetical protein